MATHANNPLIAVSRETKKRLDELGGKKQTYNEIIVYLLSLVPTKEFDAKKRICHGTPMRKVELKLGKFGYRCDECDTLLIEATK